LDLIDSKECFTLLLGFIIEYGNWDDADVDVE